MIALAAALFGGCATSAPATCDLNSDCDLGQYCGSEGVCKRDCVSASRDCPMGYSCNSIGKCDFGGAGGAGATGTSTSGPGGPGGTTSNGNPTSATDATSATATSTSTGQTGKGQLDVCFSDMECSGALRCRPMTKGAAMRCTPTCSANTDCPAGFRCQDPGDGTNVCLMSDIGRSCTVATQCDFGCLVGPKTCTASCTSGADCPNGWGCMLVGGQNVCVKAEAPCSAADASACIVPAACDESPTMVVGGCTLACNTAADCPQRAAGLAPWTCNGLCKRPSDVFGPLEGGYNPTQYACNAQSQVVNVCNDAQHIDFAQFTIPNPPAVSCSATMTTDGVAGDACVDSCRYQGACPYSFACTAVGGVAGQRIGLCLPAGFGEVGNACTKDGDCAFGYCHANKCSRDCTKDGICPTGSVCNAGGAPTVDGMAFRRCE